MLPSPQPIGIFAGAAAHLLLPMPSPTQTLTQSEARTLEQLLQGNLEVDVPLVWQFFIAAAKGDMARANHLLIEAFQSLLDASADRAPERLDIEEWFIYNRFVLDPESETLLKLPSSLTNPALLALKQVVSFSYGLTDDLPSIGNLHGELRAWSMATQASKQLEQESYLAARQTLSEAVEVARPNSRLMAAILLSQSVQLADQCQVPNELLIQELQQALDLAQSCALPGFLAELNTQLGMVLQRSAGEDRSKLLAAIRAYQQALQSSITSQNNPELFAQLQNNLGLCYLSMPQTESSAQLRTGIAIQSFRHGLESLDQQRYGDLWARISMNLASALQYAPSSHPAENLVQAVEIYEQVLQVRSRAREPIAYALTILNQANALAHLGMFKPALEKASEAYKLFQWYDQGEAAAAARELVENINQHLVAPSAQTDGSPQPHADQGTYTRQESEHGSVPATAV